MAALKSFAEIVTMTPAQLVREALELTAEVDRLGRYNEESDPFLEQLAFTDLRFALLKKYPDNVRPEMSVDDIAHEISTTYDFATTLDSIPSCS